MSCSICTEGFNASSRSCVACVQCQNSACRACYRRYFLSRFQEPNCMHCQVAFKYEYICGEFPKAFWQKEYKKHREAMLFDLERAQCVATLPYVQMASEQDVIRDDLRVVNDEIKRLRRLLQLSIRRQVELQRRFNNTNIAPAPSAAKTAEYHTPCNTPDCRGFVTKSEPKCACCKNSTCHSCHQTIDHETDHECKADDVATVQELRRNSKQCPECRVNISKIDGCDQMFCVSCHTAFSWNTGQRVTGPIHNPHYFEVRAQLGANFPIRNGQGGDGGCEDVLPDIRYFRNALSHATISRDSETTLRFATHIRQVTIPELRANGAREYSFRTNLRNRVAWMLKQRTDDEFKVLLYRNDKKSRFHSELLALFQMYVNVIGTLYNNIIVERSMQSYPNILMLKCYTREQLLAIKGRYNSTSTMYDKYLSDQATPT